MHQHLGHGSRGRSDIRLLIAQPNLDGLSETFLRAHAERLPAETRVVAWHPLSQTVAESPRTADGAVLAGGVVRKAVRKLHRAARGLPWEYELTRGYRAAIRDHAADLVLAEYGIVGAGVAEACRLEGVPLVVHFHGHDATRRSVLERFGARYRPMFAQAAAVVAVSRAMRRQLVSLGCPEEKLFLNYYGVDGDRFGGADPAAAGPTLLAVGRFVEKKAPHLTIAAFAEAFKDRPDARLRMIGDGPLLGVCRDLATGLGVGGAVTFLGAQPHEAVAREMRSARAFVQHSVEAADGDCEGTPVAVLEAGATGLPVVATRHAGIPDVVLDGETGLLCDERDVPGMAAAMRDVLDDPAAAGAMGETAGRRVRGRFSTAHSIDRLWAILRHAAGDGPAPPRVPPHLEDLDSALPSSPSRPKPALAGAAT